MINKTVSRLRKRDCMSKCNSSDVGMEDCIRNTWGAKLSHQFLKQKLSCILVCPKSEADVVIFLFAVGKGDLHLLWIYSPVETQQVENHAR